ncbi:MAG: hypothetical protein K8R58_00040, partial [Bacteroidales bacterium]|nr:hypothetical protein [Bacteroidales bacterium]
MKHKKKINLIYGLSLLVIITGILAITSCKKQDMDVQQTDNSIQPKMTAEDKAVYERIMNFKKKVEYIKEHPQYKSGEMMSVEDVQWNLDASMNFTYSFVFESFSGFYTDSVFVSLPLSGDSINLNDVSATWFELVEKITGIYNATPGNSKDLYVSITKIKEQNPGTVTFISTATIGERGESPEEQPFIEGDDWIYGDNLGL